MSNHDAPVLFLSSRQLLEYQSILSCWPSQKVQKHQAAERNEAPQDYAIPPLLRPNSRHQPINARDLSYYSSDSPSDTLQLLPLQSKAFVHSIRLRQHAIRHVVTIV